MRLLIDNCISLTTFWRMYIKGNNSFNQHPVLQYVMVPDSDKVWHLLLKSYITKSRGLCLGLFQNATILSWREAKIVLYPPFSMVAFHSYRKLQIWWIRNYQMRNVIYGFSLLSPQYCCTLAGLSCDPTTSEPLCPQQLCTIKPWG